MGMRVRGKATARPDQIEDPAFTRENGWFGLEDRNSSPPAVGRCTCRAKLVRSRKTCRGRRGVIRETWFFSAKPEFKGGHPASRGSDSK